MMMYELILMSLGLIAVPPLRMRGGTLHNHLALWIGDEFRRVGFQVEYEYPIRLQDGQIDFVDLFAHRDDGRILCEIETTPRHIDLTIRKAQAIGLPLWVILPTRKVRAAALRKLVRLNLSVHGSGIKFLLVGEAAQRLTELFPSFPLANEDCGKAKNKSEGLI